MKRKISTKLLIILLIFAISIPIISYAINLPTEKQNLFLSCNKKEANRGEKVELTLNLDLIDYENFEFTLTSNINININNFSTEEKNLEIETDSNSFKITADKSKLNIKQVDLYYQIPEEIEIGTKIELTGIVKEYKSAQTENEESSGNSDIKYSSKESEIQAEYSEQKVIITITVAQEEEKVQNQNNIENQMPENKINTQQNMRDKTSNQQTKTQQNSSSKTISSVISGGQEANTYNGESNNYLSTLEITNFNISPEFNKTNTTYFIEVGSEVTEININAEAENENATVNIYGNSNLQDGQNKVLISVTAENGDVKIYRIYVTKK